MILSVIVTAYNLEEFIEACVKSLILQFSSYEIIVVDDGSVDKTFDIVSDLAHRYNQIRILSKENGGVGDARNFGLRYAKGKFVWFVDGDDLVDRTSFIKVLNILKRSEEDVLSFGFYLIDEKGNRNDWLKLKPVFEESKVLNGEEFYLQYVRYNYVWQFVIKRELLVDKDLRFLSPYKMQDAAFLPTLMHFASKVKSYDLKLINYRQRQNSAVNSRHTSDRHFFYLSMVEVAQHIKSFKNDLDEVSTLKKGLEETLDTFNQMLFLDFINTNFDPKEESKLFELLKDYGFFPFRNIKGFTSKMNLKLNVFRTLFNQQPMLFKKIYQLVI